MSSFAILVALFSLLRIAVVHSEVRSNSRWELVLCFDRRRCYHVISRFLDAQTSLWSASTDRSTATTRRTRDSCSKCVGARVTGAKSRWTMWYTRTEDSSPPSRVSTVLNIDKKLFFRSNSWIDHFPHSRRRRRIGDYRSQLRGLVQNLPNDLFPLFIY